MTITNQTQLYTKDLKLMVGKDRKRLNGSDFDLIKDAWNILLYVAPVYDPETHQLEAVVDNGDGTCTKSVLPKVPPTEEELAQQELFSLDQVLSRGEEDILNALITKGVLTGNEPEISFVMSNKAKKEAEREKLK